MYTNRVVVYITKWRNEIARGNKNKQKGKGAKPLFVLSGKYYVIIAE